MPKTSSALIPTICLLLCLSSCQEVSSKPPRVLIVGMDGATLRVTHELMAQGKLPNLYAIAEAGASGPLRSLPTLLSPIVWTTVATGLKPSKHGVRGWVKPAVEGKTELYYSHDRNGWALWNILSAAGLSVEVVNWLITYPPDIVRGVIVSDHTFPSDVERNVVLGEFSAKGMKAELLPVKSAGKDSRAVFPQDRKDQVLDEHHRQAVATKHPDMFIDAENFPERFDREQLSRSYQHDNRLVSVALEIEAELSPRVVMILLQGVDRVSHALWACFEDPESYPQGFDLRPAERRACRAALTSYYEFTDALIGRLVSRFSDDDLVMVVSDHGFEPSYDGFLTGTHWSDAARDGILFARGRGIEPGTTPFDSTVLNIAPTILRWLGLPLARDMDGLPASFLTSYPTPPEPVDTYETSEILRVGPAVSGAEERIIDQLKKLGYVD